MFHLSPTLPGPVISPKKAGFAAEDRDRRGSTSVCRRIFGTDSNAIQTRTIRQPGGAERRRLDNRGRFERAAGFGRGKWFSTSRRARFASKSSRTTKSLTWCRRSKSGARRQRWCFSTVGACQFKDISQQLIVHRLNALGTKSKTLIILNSSFQNTPIPKIVANGPARAAPQR